MAKSKKSNKHDGTNKNKKGLTPMQMIFVKEFCVDMNASAAAVRAGYSEKAPAEIGYQLTHNPSVREAIQTELKKKFSRIDMTAERILLEMFRCATADIGDAYDEDGNLLNVKDMPEDFRRAVTGVDVLEEFDYEDRKKVKIGETKKLRLVSKDRAMELMAKHYKLLTEKLEIHDKTNMAAKLAAARKRREAGK